MLYNAHKAPGLSSWPRFIEPMLAQLCAFTGPGSIKHDDFVDAMTQCVRLCVDKGLVSVLKTKKTEYHRPPPKVVNNPYAA